MVWESLPPPAFPLERAQEGDDVRLFLRAENVSQLNINPGDLGQFRPVNGKICYPYIVNVTGSQSNDPTTCQQGILLSSPRWPTTYSTKCRDLGP